MRYVEANVLQPGDVIEIAGLRLAVFVTILDGPGVTTILEHLGGETDGLVFEFEWRWDEPVHRVRRRPPTPPGSGSALEEFDRLWRPPADGPEW